MSDKRVLLLDEGVYKELMQLSAATKAKFVAFQAKFSSDKNLNGLNFERLKSSHELYSCRVDRNFRAIMKRIKNEIYLLLSVLKHDDAYDRIDERLSVRIRAKSGAIEVHDVKATARKLFPDGDPKPDHHCAPRLFDWVTDLEFGELDLSGPILGSIRLVQDESDLAALLPHIDRYAADVLARLGDGQSVEHVLETVTAPLVSIEPVATQDFPVALRRPATAVVSSDEAVAVMLDGEVAAWQLFLHPRQQQVVDRDFDGPARITGGPGTGKTVVAVHRAARLLRESPDGGKVLLTTFGVTLAADLSAKLASLLDEDELKRVDVMNIDKLVRDLTRDMVVGRRVNEGQIAKCWQQIVVMASESDFDPQFLEAEWRQVICGQLIQSRTEYFSARRHGRIRPLGRAQRARVWELTERFLQLARQRGVWAWDQMRMEAALVAESSRTRMYQHVLVDEAQDMTAAHWRMLRALVPEARNDIFIAGDAFQRIYGRTLPLSSLGIDVRGRSSRLLVSYRITAQQLETAKHIAGDATADDLDEGPQTLDGFRSVLTGPATEFLSTPDRAAEIGAVTARLRAWIAETPAQTIAVCAYTNAEVKELTTALNRVGIPAKGVGESTPSGEVVHVSTMHKLKGLEYYRVILTGMSDKYPHSKIAELADTDPQAHQDAMLAARNLLFVAATRARDVLSVTWHGNPSTLLHKAITTIGIPTG